MCPLSRDTHPDADKVQIDLLRRAGMARRLALACSLSQTVIELLRMSIVRDNPGIDKKKERQLFLERCYGTDLAGRVIAYMNRTEHARG